MTTTPTTPPATVKTPAHMKGWHLSAGDEHVVFDARNEQIVNVQCGGMTGRKYGEASDIARLIAAAPALLEALRASIDAIEDDRGLDDYICCSGYMCGCQGSSKRQLMLHDLRAALSAATGEA